MSENFYVDVSAANELKGCRFGVFMGVVSTPDVYVCGTNDKLFSRFFYVINGTITFDKGTAKEITASAGTVVYLPNNVTYKSEWSAGTEGKYISVNFQLDKLYISLPDNICIAAVDKNNYYLNMFKKIYDIWIKGALGYKIEVLSEIYRLIYSLMSENIYSHAKTEHNIIYKGILYLENNYLSDVSVSELADMCNTCESNFRRLFRRYKQMSPVTYKNHLRIQKACDLLRTGEYSVTEAAYAVNIDDISYFYKLFTRFAGCSPKHFIPYESDKR